MSNDIGVSVVDDQKGHNKDVVSRFVSLPLLNKIGTWRRFRIYFLPRWNRFLLHVSNEINEIIHIRDEYGLKQSLKYAFYAVVRLPKRFSARLKGQYGVY